VWLHPERAAASILLPVQLFLCVHRTAQFGKLPEGTACVMFNAVHVASCVVLSSCVVWGSLLEASTADQQQLRSALLADYMHG
jgi:hypothetical protein